MSDPRTEDLTWMADTGEHAEGAAQRLGISFGTLGKWANRNAPDAWARLLARRPRDHNYRTGGKNQWSAS